MRREERGEAAHTRPIESEIEREIARALAGAEREGEGEEGRARLRTDLCALLGDAAESSKGDAAQAEEQLRLSPIHQPRDRAENLLTPALQFGLIGRHAAGGPCRAIGRTQPLPERVARLEQRLERRFVYELREQRGRLGPPVVLLDRHHVLLGLD